MLTKKLIIGPLVLLMMPNAWAINGLNLIGFGVESSTMGGAYLAVARDALALNTNPAGLSKISNRQLDLYAGATVFHVSHSDQFQQHVSSDNNVRGAGQFGYAWKMADGKLNHYALKVLDLTIPRSYSHHPYLKDFDDVPGIFQPFHP